MPRKIAKKIWQQPSSNRPILNSFRGTSELSESSNCDLVRPAMAPIKWSSTPSEKKVSHRDGKIDDKVSGRVDAINDPQPSGYRELLALQQLVNAHASYDLNDPKILIDLTLGRERVVLPFPVLSKES
ncbi:hypothetical protein K0M31_019777 [Melipona bicolor]|uniref:Uncharacterized protein n=1 Tax=Melipona bicolor TaxID=60889 RepID=A0AA40KRI2_9HYME|nr:hypothetical protein K0M31_019777 [Melipona bicolor]